MTATANYAGILRNITLGQAGSFIGFMTLAALLFLVAFELKQARDIAEIELSTQRHEMYNKVSGIYDLNSRIKKDEVIRKLLKEGLDALTAAEFSVAWVSVEGLLGLAEMQYRTYKMGLRSEDLTEEDLTATASLLCYFPTLSREILGNDEFGIEVKKRAAEINCSKIPSLLFDERQKAR